MGSSSAFFKFLLLSLLISLSVSGIFTLRDFNLLYSGSLKRAVLSNITGSNAILGKLSLSRKNNDTFLLFVGDIMLDRGVAYFIKKHDDVKFPFLKSAEILKSADLTIGNLEGPISDRGTKSGSIYSFRFDPKVLEGLTYAGFDVLSLANNHIFDYGREALVDTREHLKNADISGVGAGANYGEVNKPAILEVKGAKFSFLSYTDLYPRSLYATPEKSLRDLGASTARPGISEFDPETILKQVKELKQNDDFVTVLLHFGDEYTKEPNKKQREFAKVLADAGADLIVGHHPHVVQPVEKIGDTWVAWSLGNFVFDQGFSEETMRGLALGVLVRDGKVLSVLTVPVVLNNMFQPEIKVLELGEL